MRGGAQVCMSHCCLPLAWSLILAACTCMQVPDELRRGVGWGWGHVLDRAHLALIVPSAATFCTLVC